MRTSRLAIIALIATVALQRATSAQSLTLSLFERYLEPLRQQAGIPGLSAAIVQGGQIVWGKGFGSQNLERSIGATVDTPYPICDLSQTFAAVLLLQSVERGNLDLIDPIRRWTTLIPEPGATVQEVVTHSSKGAPAGRFEYDPARYTALTPVIEYYQGREAYRKILARDVLDRLAMIDSVPGHDLADPSATARLLFEPERVDRYVAVLSRLAVPYRISNGRPVRSAYPPRHIDASIGIVSTVRDLVRYISALDDGVLVRPETLQIMWSNAVTRTGVALPTGLGWFVQSYNGHRIVWHFGLSSGSFSSLIIKVADRDLTLILLANSDGLNASFQLSAGDVTTSLFAKVFLRLFA